MHFHCAACPTLPYPNTRPCQKLQNTREMKQIWVFLTRPANVPSTYYLVVGGGHIISPKVDFLVL